MRSRAPGTGGSAEHAARILEAVERTGRRLRVTMNYRYLEGPARVCELIRDGVIGRPLHVDFRWVLDTRHGADYFRRWHREREHSGGLLVHKASHHFDLVQWWLGSTAREVAAFGALAFYGATNARARGEHYPYERYTGAAEAADDPFALRLDRDEALRELYLQAEAETGYLRDRNVFGEGITIDDTLSVSARYRSGALLSYSLVAYSPWEGYRVALTGELGRIELDQTDTAGALFVGGERQEATDAGGPQVEVRVFPMFGEPYAVPIEASASGHADADRRLCEQLFAARPLFDPLDRLADHVDGAASVLVGAAANASIASGRVVDVEKLLGRPLTREAAAV